MINKENILNLFKNYNFSNYTYNQLNYENIKNYMDYITIINQYDLQDLNTNKKLKNFFPVLIKE